MYDYLEGKLAVRKPNYVVVDVGGVGYRVEIPLSTYRKLSPNGSAKLFTFLKVSENDLRLYGFATEVEREVFLRLVESVPQLGPSKAIAILSSIEVEDLLRAVEEGDTDTMQRVRGVGAKIASRLVLELKGKLPEAGRTAGEAEEGASMIKDAAHALVSLGYDRAEADRAVRSVRKNLKGEVTVESLLRACLEKS